MFNDVTVGGGVQGGKQEAPLKAHRSSIQALLMRLAGRRRNEQGPTADVQAAFKEGEKSPVAGASL